jgi:hypothetical protein
VLTLFLISYTQNLNHDERTLGASDTWSTIVLVLVHLVSVGSSAPPLPVVGLFKSDFVNVSLFGGLGNGVSSGEGLLEKRDESGVDRSGEVDLDLDIEVSEFVVSVRWHTLTRDDLERVYLLD